MTKTTREVFVDAEDLAIHGAALLNAAVGTARRPPRICLAGGSTPKRLYELLAGPPFVFEFPWDVAHWFFGDERFVPHDHKDSNARMVSEALFNKVPVSSDNKHFVPTRASSPEVTAASYERELQKIYGAETLDPKEPMFDIVLVGFGDDGHTASLFPGTPAVNETTRWMATTVGVKPEPRLSLTFPVLNSARHVIILGAGASKADVVKRVARGEDLPLTKIRPTGELHWMLDKAAAGEK